MSKILSAERHDEVMEKLDTISAQLHHLSNTSRAMGKVISATGTKFWEIQCREKDATLTEVLRKNAALETALEAAQDEIGDLKTRLNVEFDRTYRGVRIDCEATRAALDAIIKAFLVRPKTKA